MTKNMLIKDDLTLSDFEQLWDIESKYFPPDMISDAELCHAWHRKNPRTTQAWFDDKGKMVGFVTSLPISDKTYKDFCDGAYNDVEMPASDILEYEKNKNYKLYFCSIALRPDYKGKGNLDKLLKLWTDDLAKLYQEDNIRITGMIAEAITPDGARVLNRMGMKYVKESDHSSKVFVKEFPEDGYLRSIRQLVKTGRGGKDGQVR